MAGLDLSASRSGKTAETAPAVISKRGKAHLRYMLYQAAFIASSRNGQFMKCYTEKLDGRQKERGIKTKMRVKLAAKLLVTAWMLMKKEPFDPRFFTIQLHANIESAREPGRQRSGIRPRAGQSRASPQSQSLG